MKPASTISSKSSKDPAFVIRAERAFQRASESVKKQNRTLGLPLVLWTNGKLCHQPA